MDSKFTQSYRNVQSAVQSESDSSDSDSGDDAWKRKSSRKRVPESPVKAVDTELPLKTEDNVLCNTKKRRFNTVWCNVLQEQTVSADLLQFGLKSKPVSFQDRSCESYDFRLSAEDPRKETFMEDEDCDSSLYKDDCDDELVKDANENLDHKNSSQRWWPKSQREKPDVVDKVAKKIIKVLNEPKHHIIYRVVKVLGSQKALDLLEETEKIEDNGGMFVLDNSRRRTPGGIFLQLLKKDSTISNKKKNTIFAEDRRMTGKMFKSRNIKKKKKGKKSSESMDVVCDPADSSDNKDQEVEDVKVEINDEKEGTFEENVVSNSSNGIDATDIQDVKNNICAKEDSELEEGEVTD